jgi:hypothetical protein
LAEPADAAGMQASRSAHVSPVSLVNVIAAFVVDEDQTDTSHHILFQSPQLTNMKA